MTALIVGAHPDDETLGAGGVTAKMTAAGREVAWLILTGPTSSRGEPAVAESEVERAASILGVHDVVVGGWPDNRLDGIDLLDVVQFVEEAIERIRPSLVLTHHAGDVNVDHRVAHDAVLAATRPTPAHPVRTVATFEVASSTEWGFGTRASFSPNVFVDVSDTIDRKIRALEAYGSEVRDPPHPRSGEAVRAQAVVRGAAVGVAAAEAFHLLRTVRP